ncbi:MAG: hypothetical protein K8S22_02955 [Betaproteobacteria bacterium]|nr:hypothetical protein [Betaproteobacteria bacterium]
MKIRTKTIAVCLLAFAPAAIAPATAADTPAKAVKAPVAKTAKAAAPKAVRAPALEKLTCRTGPNDEQVRLIVEAVKGPTACITAACTAALTGRSRSC